MNVIFFLALMTGQLGTRTIHIFQRIVVFMITTIVTIIVTAMHIMVSISKYSSMNLVEWPLNSTHFVENIYVKSSFCVCVCAVSQRVSYTYRVTCKFHEIIYEFKRRFVCWCFSRCGPVFLVTASKWTFLFLATSGKSAQSFHLINRISLIK